MPDRWRYLIDEDIDHRFEKMVQLRRQLHSQPEPSGEEYQTSLSLYQSLADAGFAVAMGPEGRGVMADFPADRRRTASQTPLRVALRADIDALRIYEQNQTPYRSQRDGLMHACGHDAHTAVIWGVLNCLAELSRSGQLPWPVGVRGVFQPAEETATGARDMVQAGVLNDVGAIFACHVDPSRGVGRIGLRTGVLTANCDAMKVTIHGRGGHAARPHEASDPIAAAAQFINALYLSIPRVTDSQDAVVVTIGQVTAGHNANVIPDQVELCGTLRTLDSRVREETIGHIRRIAEGVGRMWRTTIKLEFAEGAKSVVNDSKLIDMLRRASADVVGCEGVESIHRPSMGSEDFAYYLDHVPGALFRLGCASPRVGASGLHTPTFDIDEESLRIGAKVLARAAVLWCDPQRAAREFDAMQDLLA
jgi:amidohydrolase